jgi:5-methyltetrahydropteroyltriglutamate--homocysteine methyltransferase
MKLELILHGFYPRPEALVEASRGLDRGRITEEEFTIVLEEAQENLFTLQRQLGCLYLDSGYLNWADRFRPFIESCRGLKAGPLTRFAETNTFFKPPIVTGKIELDSERLLTWFVKPESSPWKVTLPSPLHFAAAAGKINPEKVRIFSDLLLQTLKLLRQRGVALVEFADPVLGRREAGAAVGELVAFHARLKELDPDLKTAYFVEMAPFDPAADLISTLPVDAWGIDLTRTSIDQLPQDLRGKTLILGCLDAANSLIEKREPIQRALESVSSRLAPELVFLTSNTALEFVPASRARAKLAVLREVKDHYHQEEAG